MPARWIASLLFVLLSISPGVWAQTPDPSGHEGMQMPRPMPEGHTHASTSMPARPLAIDRARDGSGTSWLPDASPMRGPMRHVGSWMLMAHGGAFLEYMRATGDRGDDHAGSINWIMGMAERPVAGGQMQVRGMISLDPLTVGRCGYPTLLQSGEFCRGDALHDRQHPHDLFMELAVDYQRAIGDAVAIGVYGGPAGEPALGPTAFPHRFSAMPNPGPPISHHWLDSTHISFGVVTGAVYGRTWKAEASVFNGREPDDRRYDFDLGPLDSWSGRVWILPSPNWALQVSAGRLAEAEAQPGEPPEDVTRVTASATWHRIVNERVWATTVAWGRNDEHGAATPAFLAETAADVGRADTIFARAEVVEKTGADLALPLDAHDTVRVAKTTVGYARWMAEGRGLRAGLGASAGLAFVPASLRPFYGSRTPGEFAVFFAVRPR